MRTDIRESHGFGVVRAFVRHGVGEKRCTKNQSPKFPDPPAEAAHGQRHDLAIEPMVTQGTYDARPEGRLTTVTADGKLAAHYENSILITDGEPEILTVTEGL